MDLHAEPGLACARARGEFMDLGGESYYAITQVDELSPFFISVVSDDDHWLFVSSTGGLTAGRVSPEFALFPYVTVDKIHDSAPHTGSLTLVRIRSRQGLEFWEPFNREQIGRYRLTRNLYKNTLGNKLCFEEINHTLGLGFRYTWMTSRRYGFVRESELINLGRADLQLEILDGLQNLLPADTPLFTQTHSSNLVDAYKWTELDEATGLGIMTLYSAITDRAEPSESLKATTAFCLGLEQATILLSSTQMEEFRRGNTLHTELHKRGIRAAYLVGTELDLPAGASRRWRLVVNAQQTQKQVVALRQELGQPAALDETISADVAAGADRLARIMASADGFQAAAEEEVAVHHYANVLFNVLRGGIFHDQHRVSAKDFSDTVRHFNRGIHDRHQALLDGLPTNLEFEELAEAVTRSGDAQLFRLTGEYLPITFGRRHGDPSRPWNQFQIRLRDERGNPLLNYAGNWRDIFQNWEALAWSFPAFIENMIAKFVNASTMDGYNPYRIMKEGIDWEVEDPDDPWSYIGYWGDHQIIYLQKLLELSSHFHPARLHSLLREELFSYANVPYRIKSFEDLLTDPKNTVLFDEQLAQAIEQRVENIGADGKLVLDDNEQVYQVNLLEKLLVPLLAKLGNLVVDGGIWLNTQRPEWNDANNALVGHGLSMVTLYYMRRYVAFLQALIAEEKDAFSLSAEVAQWLAQTSEALSSLLENLGPEPVDPGTRYQALSQLGQAASRYRTAIYERNGFSGKVDQSAASVRQLLADAMGIMDHSIAKNRREDGLFHAYNLVHLRDESIEIEPLYPMLEGQVAALSSGAVDPDTAAEVIDALFGSPVFRPDQHSFMLYPDRPLPSFLEKNRISDEQAATLPFIDHMLSRGDERILLRDADGQLRFSAEFRNVADLHTQINHLVKDYGAEAESARRPLADLYEQVFKHKAFTGRSGTMFGFEGLGSIYWHMVAKLLLAVQENFFAALDQGETATAKRLGHLYYRVREGLGFNKTPAEYGAFPTDPYSHTPGHAGAQQPGMTGQVKEEIITRFGELGLRVDQGRARFEPALLRAREFLAEPGRLRYLDIAGEWQDLELPAGSLAFTWCQVPIVYRLDDTQAATLSIVRLDGSRTSSPRTELSGEDSAELFRRSGTIKRLELCFPRAALLNDQVS